MRSEEALGLGSSLSSAFRFETWITVRSDSLGSVIHKMAAGTREEIRKAR